MPLFVIMLVQAPFTLLFDKVRWAFFIASSPALSVSRSLRSLCCADCVADAPLPTFAAWLVLDPSVCRKAPRALLSLVTMSVQEAMAASREQPVGDRLDIAMVSRAGMRSIPCG